jgi:hypothetical protein
VAQDPDIHSGEMDAALWRVLALPVEAATAALARHDARLAAMTAIGAGGVADGAIARAHAFEAQALVGLLGGQAALEDIVLNDAGMDARVPSTDVVKAVSLLALRRSLARRKPDDVMSPAGLGGLTGVAAAQDAASDPPARPPGFRPWEMPSPSREIEDHDELDDGLPPLGDDDEAPEQPGAALRQAEALLARGRRQLASFNDLATPEGRKTMGLSDPAYGEAERFGGWRAALEAVQELPAVLAAAMALDAWLIVEPSEHRGELGFLLAATLLRQRGLARQHMPALAFGHRRRRIRWSPHLPRRARLTGLLDGIAESARAGDADLDRLWLAREVMLRRCEGRSKNSRLPGLVELFIGSPLVTVQLAAARLGVTPQAVEAMLKELGSSLPREITGRKRYRAWGVL